MTREEALAQLRNGPGINEDVSEEYNEAVDIAIEALEQEPRKGHWIFQKITHGKRIWCSNCDSSFDLCCNQTTEYDEATRKTYRWSYCPWCGAKMIDTQSN